MGQKPIKTNDSGTRNRERGKSGHPAPEKNSNVPRKGRQQKHHEDEENKPEEQVTGLNKGGVSSAWGPEEDNYTEEDEYFDNHGRKGRRRRY